MARRQWSVEVIPSNRSCRDESRSFSGRENWNSIKIDRIWRPRFNQALFLGRLFNALWMIVAWSLRAFRFRNVPDVLLVATDPVASVLVVRVWKFFHPRLVVAHWCFDLYPEAAVAQGILQENEFTA